MTHPMVFISYCRQDRVWKERISRHLRVLDDWEVWDDQQISMGNDWLPAIQEAIERAQVAILVISVDYLNSPFIQEKELPELLRRREEKRLIVVPVIACPTAWQSVEWLAKINCYPPDGRALSIGQDAQIDVDLANLALAVKELLRQPSEERTVRPPLAPQPTASSVDCDPKHGPALSSEQKAPVDDDLANLALKVRELPEQQAEEHTIPPSRPPGLALFASIGVIVLIGISIFYHYRMPPVSVSQPPKTETSPAFSRPVPTPIPPVSSSPVPPPPPAPHLKKRAFTVEVKDENGPVAGYDVRLDKARADRTPTPVEYVFDLTVDKKQATLEAQKGSIRCSGVIKLQYQTHIVVSIYNRNGDPYECKI